MSLDLLLRSAGSTDPISVPKRYGRSGYAS